LATPSSTAVAGINCISPIAPFVETATGLNADSTWITARTRSAATFCWRECWTIDASKGALLPVEVNGVVARTEAALWTA
jgi:hypothetical protein